MKSLSRLCLPARVTAAAALALTAVSPAQEGRSGEGLEVLTYLEPSRSIEMSPAEAGIISEILVKEGDRVTKDQILLKLDSETIQARLSVASAQADNMGTIHAAESEYNLQKDRYEKLASLEKRDVSSQYEVARQLALLKTAQGRLTEALEMKRIYQLQMEQARAELERRYLKSPIDGIVVEILKDVAEPVNPIQNARNEYLIRVVKVDELLAVAHVPGSFASRVVEGTEMKLKIEDATGGTPLIVSGRVEFVSPVIDSASNTVRIRLAVDNSKGNIRPGSPAQLLIPDSTLAGAGELPGIGLKP